MSRVRRVKNQKEMEKSIDEFITRGYKITSEGQDSTRLKERDWGDPGAHVILAVISGWWTFGLSNALYAIYSYVTSDEILIVVDEESENGN